MTIKQCVDGYICLDLSFIECMVKFRRVLSNGEKRCVY